MEEPTPYIQIGYDIAFAKCILMVFVTLKSRDTRIRIGRIRMDNWTSERQSQIFLFE